MDPKLGHHYFGGPLGLLFVHSSDPFVPDLVLWGGYYFGLFLTDPWVLGGIPAGSLAASLKFTRNQGP